MRQVRLLEDRAMLTIAGYGAKPDANCEFIEVSQKHKTFITKALLALVLLFHQFERYYWNLYEVRVVRDLIKGKKFDLIIANDNATLPLALKIADGKPVWADAHEYSPREFDDKPVWRLLFAPYQDYLCRTYLPHTALMTTVCQGIADAYRIHYGVSSIVVMNMPAYQRLKPSPIEAGKVRMIHHGAAIRSRHLEVIIDVMAHLDERFSLDLMLVESDTTYMRDLKARAHSDPRIHFIPPVSMDGICAHINRYDVGIYLLPPVNFNHELALPNKFFEFIQARLAVAIGPSPEMASIVRRFGLGVVASSFKPIDLASKLKVFAESDLSIYKQAAHVAATDLCFEGSICILLDQIDALLGKTISNA